MRPIVLDLSQTPAVTRTVTVTAKSTHGRPDQPQETFLGKAAGDPDKKSIGRAKNQLAVKPVG